MPGDPQSADLSALEAWLASVGAARAVQSFLSLWPGLAAFVVDRDRRVIAWSEGAERLLGMAAEEVLGEHCLKANRCQACMTGCGLTRHGALRDVPLTLYRADGEPVAVRKFARPLFDEQGAFAGGIELLVPEPSAAPVAPPADDAEVVRFHGMLSADPAMHRVFQICRNVAETETSALVRGDSGSGKELVARALHAESSRRDGPFLAVNCAALTPSLMESELFGHSAGAFTGAVRDRRGIFEQADGGTLFLDEVAELPLELQAKLLRVLETHEVVPVGGERPRRVDVRIVAATHRSLRRAVADGRFREDLMFRLRVVPIFLPPLRERKRDIELLLWHFIGTRNAKGPRAVTAIAPPAMRALLDHRWPGNVRELKNVVDYAFAVGRGPEITREQLPPELAGEAQRSLPSAVHPRGAPAQRTAGSSIEQERARVIRALDEAGGHVGRAAKALGISRATLWRRRKRLGLSP